MIGAIVGDIAGSRFEFHNRKTKEFTLLVSRGEEERCCYFTDDTVMTLAVAQALADWRERGSADYGELSALAVRAMQDFVRRYPSAGYGGHFAQWISEGAIRNAISIGGDSDTIGAICGAAAEAFYGVPDEIRAKAMTFLPRHLLGVLERAESVFG